MTFLSMNLSISAGQSSLVNQSMSQPESQAVYQPQSVSQSASQLVSKLVSGEVSKLVSKSATSQSVRKDAKQSLVIVVATFVSKVKLTWKIESRRKYWNFIRLNRFDIADSLCCMYAIDRFPQFLRCKVQLHFINT